LEHYPDALTIFVQPESIEELDRRLTAAGHGNAKAIERRLEVARREWPQAERYRYRVTNDDLDRRRRSALRNTETFSEDIEILVHDRRLREESIVNKVGGRFKLSTLIQKRLVALNPGARPLVELQLKRQDAGRARPKSSTTRSSSTRRATCALPARAIRPAARRNSTSTRCNRLELNGSPSMLAGREIVVGVTGGIAAFKTAALVSKLVQDGAASQRRDDRRRNAGSSVRATFEALTGRPVYRTVFDNAEFPLGAHIGLAERAQLLCIAPATADFMAKAATVPPTILLSTLYLAFGGRVLMAPAMNTQMWAAPAVATQRRAAARRRRDYSSTPAKAGSAAARREPVAWPSPTRSAPPLRKLLG
jgi:phosphopantothenoylcysteine decarboxylase